MSKLISCSRCVKFFETDGWQTLCLDCIEQDEKDFRRIREYIYEHPGAKIFDVSLNLDVSIAKIKRYLREGRLEIMEKNNLFLKCEMCGKPICSGNYCDDCFKQVNHDYKAVFVGKSASKTKSSLNYIKP